MVVMGRIAGAYAVAGWVKLQVFTASVDSLLQHRRWWLRHGEGWEEREVQEAAVHGRGVVARLAGCADREAAAALRGAEVAVPRSALPDSGPGEYYCTDLLGLHVANQQGEELGAIVDLLETGGQQVLVVQGERERLIPFVGPVVQAVDLAQGKVVVDWGADF
jgi:16S rRNA processing protein RimM